MSERPKKSFGQTLEHGEGGRRVEPRVENEIKNLSLVLLFFWTVMVFEETNRTDFEVNYRPSAQDLAASNGERTYCRPC